MKQGAESFCWWNLFEGVYTPEFLLSYRGISPAAKLCFSRLLKYTGKNESCWPAQETLAENLGVSVRSIGGYLAELERDGFIEIIQRGMGRPNEYRPLQHRLISGLLTGTTSGLDRQDVSGLDRQDVSGPSKELKEIKQQENQTATPVAGSTSEDTQGEVNYPTARTVLEKHLGRGLKKPERDALLAAVPLAMEESEIPAWAKTNGVVGEKAQQHAKPELRREYRSTTEYSKAKPSAPSAALVVVRDIRAEVAKSPAIQALFYQFMKNGRELTEPDMEEGVDAITELRLTDDDLKVAAGHAERNFPKWSHLPGPGNYLRKHKPWTTLRIDKPPQAPKPVSTLSPKSQAALEMYYRDHPNERPVA